MKLNDLEQLGYMATQPLVGGFDEVQQLFLCYVMGNHVALSGPPGVGKTTLVEEFCQALKLPLVSRVMGPKVNESLLISYPDLVYKEGATITVTKPGLLAKALREGAVYFADEIDRLSEDNQKLHNSAFDNRRSVTLRDGRTIKGNAGFFGVIAYNPTEGVKNDLETALADRFVHLNFEYFAPEVESMVTLQKLGLSPHESLDIEWRAVHYSIAENARAVRFFKVVPSESGVLFKNPYTGEEINPEGLQGNVFVYRAIRPPANQTKGYIQPKTFSLEDLSLRMAGLCGDFRSLSLQGTRKLPKDLLAKFKQDGADLSASSLKLHLPSSRIQQAALCQYAYLVNHLRVEPAQAQEYAVSVLINQVAYGKFGKRRLGEATNKELLVTLAGAKGLLPMRKQALPTAKPKSKLFSR